MHENNKIYGFTITLYEFSHTIETLWSTVRNFITEHPGYIAQNSAMDFISDNGGADYNLCHSSADFVARWVRNSLSNFEIADMDFWCGDTYSASFEYLNSRGGFYYEHWGNAPVHLIGASLLAGADRIHMFRDIGYERPPYMHCPVEGALWERGPCGCDRAQNFDYDWYSCLLRWDQVEERVGGRK